MTRAARWIAASLGTHVFQIIGLRADKHMRWIDAGWVITAMAEKHSNWDDGDQQFISHSMGEVKTAVVTHDFPVSTLFGRCQPRPTFILTPDLNLFPKAISQRMSMMAFSCVHHDAPILCRRTKNSVPQPTKPDRHQSKRPALPRPSQPRHSMQQRRPSPWLCSTAP